MKLSELEQRMMEEIIGAKTSRMNENPDDVKRHTTALRKLSEVYVATFDQDTKTTQRKLQAVELPDLPASSSLSLDEPMSYPGHLGSAAE